MKYIVIVCLLGTFLSSAQEAPNLSSYDWEGKPEFNWPPESLGDMKGVYEKYAVEFRYADTGELEEYDLEHRALWLNSDERIEEFNKVYLPFSSDSELLTAKARVLKASGEIINLKETSIHTAEDKESGKIYKYFAFEGIEKGSVIEYLILEKKKPEYSGRCFWLQSDYAKELLEFDLIAPKNLEFKVKTYNGLPQMIRDTANPEVFHLALNVNTLSGLEKEDQANFDANRGYAVYKLDRNRANNKSGITSYSGIARNIYGYYHQPPEKKAGRLLNELLQDKIGIDPTSDPELKIQELERYLKSHIYLTKSGGSADLETVLENSVASETGIVKLYVAAMNALEIPFQIVLTSNRSSTRFDPDFEAGNYLTDFLFYFPEYDKYLEPASDDSRYGYPSGNLLDNYGLFIEEIKIGDFVSAVGKVKYLEPVAAERSMDKMKIEVAFDQEDLTRNTVKLRRGFSGYYGMYFHPFMTVVKEDDKRDLVESFAHSIHSALKVDQISIENEAPEFFGHKPIIFDMDISADVLTEKAGNRYLFKVGALIGEQMEMYQDKRRNQPLENPFKRTYEREINMVIPSGYQVANLEDLLLDETYSEDGEVLYFFKSDYQLDGNLLRITANEQYNRNIIPVERFEDYRNVINGAADFNKVVLVLEPTAK